MGTTRARLGWAAAIAFGVAVALFRPVSAQEQTAAAQPSATEDQAPEPLSDDELEELVAPIALYPDELVAVICSASLFPLQIVEAERFLEKRAKDKSLQPKESWDGSVISLLNYPEVVKMMSEDLDWTQALGDALANQQKDVLMAIQQLRDEAVAKDIIKSDDKIQVVSSGDNVVIQSTNPEKIYVPRYEPEMLYAANYPPQPISYYDDAYPSYYYPAAGFFAGAVTGAVWGAVVDWDDWGVWGGRWDGDVDIDCNHCLNNINGKVNWKDIDWKNVDRSKLNISRDQLAKIDRTKIRDGIEANSANSIRSKADNIRRERTTNVSDRATQARDIRKNALNNTQRKSGDLARSRTQRPSATQFDARQKAAGAGGQRKVANRPSGKQKAGARIDNRPRKPTAIGNPGRGKATRVNSNRGRQSLGGGYRGGGHAARGGGHRGGGAVRRGGGGGRRR